MPETLLTDACEMVMNEVMRKGSGRAMEGNGDVVTVLGRL